MGWLFGGGGSSETSVEIPDWLQDAIKPLYSGTTDKYGDWQQRLWNQMMGGGSGGGGASGGGAPETYTGDGVRGGDQGRATPDMPWYQSDPYNTWDQWNEGGWQPSEEGILGDNSRTIVGPSPWEQRAAQLSTTLTDGQPMWGKAANMYDRLSGMNDLERQANRLGQVYADPNNSPYEHKAASEWLHEMRRAAVSPVDFSGYESDPLFNQQMEAWEANIDPKLSNAANSMGLGRSGAKIAAKGLSKTNAVRDAMKEYITQKNTNKDRAVGGLSSAAGQMTGLSRDVRGARSQNLSTKLGLAGNLRGGQTSAAQGYTGIGDRSQQQKLDAINNLNAIGQQMRGVRQDQADAPWEDFMRRASAFESSLNGPMGMIPGMFGSSSTSRKKNK